MKDEIKEIRDYISCPQFGDNHYGKWGVLRLDQRKKIKNLLDYITNLQREVRANNDLIPYFKNKEKELKKKITNLQEENERLKEELLSKPDNEITLETADGQRMTIIQSERINMQEKLNKSLEELYKKYNDYKTRNEKAIERLKFALKCKDSELQCVFEAYEIEKMIRDLQEKSDE